MSVVKGYCKIEKSPLTKPVPEAFGMPASDWPKKFFFWPISEEERPGDSAVFLHEVVFLIDRHRDQFKNASLALYTIYNDVISMKV